MAKCDLCGQPCFCFGHSKWVTGQLDLLLSEAKKYQLEKEMSDKKPHPHAELIQQWADDHQTIPPRHQWEFCGKNEYDKKWVLLSLAPAWSPSIDYRRVAKSIPHPNAERLTQWAADNQTVPPTHTWEFMVLEQPEQGWFPVTSMTARPNDNCLYRRTMV